MSGSNKNKAKEKPTHPNSNPKKSGKTVPAMNTVRAVSPELSPPSSPGTATASATASANRPSTSQPTLASVMAAIGKLDEDMNTRFNTLDCTLHQVQTSLADHTSRISDLEGFAADHESRITDLEKQCTELLEINKSTKRKLIDLENRSRRCNIKITGLPEKVEKGNPTQFVTELLPQLLGANNFTSGLKVDRAHRIGPPAAGRQRTMIARIHHPPEKEKILKLARLHAPLTYNGARISVYPDFSPKVTEQRRAFDGAKKKLRDAGVKHGILFPARLTFNYGTEQKIFQDAKDAETFIDRFITSSAAAE